MTSRLVHNIDMLLGLSERLLRLSMAHPRAFTHRYTSIMELVNKQERPGMKRMTQCDTILFLLRKGCRLTKMEMQVHHKIASPTARVEELRKRGHNIVSHWKRCPVDGSEYVEYVLEESEEQAA